MISPLHPPTKMPSAPGICQRCTADKRFEEQVCVMAASEITHFNHKTTPGYTERETKGERETEGERGIERQREGDGSAGRRVRA